jgi:hypothetical protein
MHALMWEKKIQSMYMPKGPLGLPNETHAEACTMFFEMLTLFSGKYHAVVKNQPSN